MSLTPAQAFPMVGVIMIKPTMGFTVLFIGAFQGTKFPCPEAGIPIFVLELVQVKDAPAGILWNAGGAILIPGQTETLFKPVI